MDFTMEVAKKVMLNKIKASATTNLVISPLALNVILNMAAANMNPGDALEKLTSVLGCKSLDDVTAASWNIMALQCHVSNDGEPARLGPGAVLDVNCDEYDSDYCKREEDVDAIKRSYFTPPPVLSLVNGAWAAKHYPLKPYFQQVVKDVYNGDLRFVDFANEGNKVVDEVNLWAKTATRGRIKQLLKPNSFDEDTFLVLENALYFKATWDQLFSKSKSKDKGFHLLDGRQISVPSMGGDKEWREYADFDGFKILRLPYSQSEVCQPRQFAMYIFLPDKTHGLSDLIQKVGSGPTFLNQDFKVKEVELNELWIPKFKFSYHFKASKVLKELGVRFAFDKAEDVKILQKANIEVDEVGTEGVAVCLGEIWGCDFPDPIQDCFVADHPFIFLIREEISKLVLFVGAVLDPSCGD